MVTISSPSKNTTSALSLAGNREYKVEDLERYIKKDIEKATTCDIDALAKHFLYLALDDECTKKKTLTKLQVEIEKYESKQYYGSAEVTDIDKTMYEKSCQDKKNLLDDLLKQSLTAVLPIANETSIQNNLKDYCKRATHETKRYAPYVNLCNQALEKMKASKNISDFVFRESSSLDIRFLRSDPKVVKSSYKEVKEDLQRKPGIGVTSSTAAKKVTTDDPWKEPTVGFTWPRLLMVNEIKMKNKQLAYSKSDYVDTTRQLLLMSSMKSSSNLHRGYVKVPASDLDEGLGAKKRQISETSNGEGSRATKKQRIATPVGGESENALGQNEAESKSEHQASTRVQCAGYALEMMSYSIGVHHVINLIIIDEKLWIWYYDRQSIIKTDGISIVKDLPRFLVLLFAFQRFTLEDWGIIPSLNPDAVHSHTVQPETNQSKPEEKGKGKQQNQFEGDEANHKRTAKIDIAEHLEDCETANNIINVTIHLNELLSYHPHRLSGRATGVFKANARPANLPMICKVSHPEVQRQHEGKTVGIARYMAKKFEGMIKHLPTVYFYGDLKGTSTHRIRSMVGIPWKGHRTCRIIGSKELQPITSLHTGPEFIKAWFEVLTCHAYLWKCRIEHGDPSVNNMMYDKENGCGVLTDFDLSIFQWEPCVVGVNRMGTVPFMALKLLTEEYWNGEVKRYYHHELESFIWIIIYVFLVYQDGQRQNVDVVKSWETSDYVVCRSQKRDFLDNFRSDVQPNYKELKLFVTFLVAGLNDVIYKQTQDKLESIVEANSASHPASHSEYTWEVFIRRFEQIERKMGLGPDFLNAVSRLKDCRPDFTPISPESSEAGALRVEVSNYTYEL